MTSTLELRRAAAASNRMMLNALILGATGAYLLWPDAADGRLGPLWAALGVVFLLWAAFVAFNMLRPMLMRLTAEGVYAQGVFGAHHFGWDALKWVDLSRPAGGGVLCYGKPASAKEGFVVLTRKDVTDAHRAEALQYILGQRSDVPTANPNTLVSLGSHTT